MHAGKRSQKTNDRARDRRLQSVIPVGLGRASDVARRHIRADNLEHRRLDVTIGDALDVTVAHSLVPDLQRL